MRQSNIDTQTPQQLLVAKEERRQKREERRAKQSIANIGRAEKMHELRIQSEKNNEPQVIFSFPPNQKSAMKATPQKTPNYYRHSFEYS